MSPPNSVSASHFNWPFENLADSQNGYYSDWPDALKSVRLWRWSCGLNLVRTFGKLGSGERSRSKHWPRTLAYPTVTSARSSEG